jgi:hypothetical protein
VWTDSQGEAIAQASRASFATLTSEDYPTSVGGQPNGIGPSSTSSTPSRRQSDARDVPGTSPMTRSQSRDQRMPMPFMDEGTRSLLSLHQSAFFRAFAVAPFTAGSAHVDGYPCISFLAGQEFEVIFEKDERWLARMPGTNELGWIPKSHCIEILM